MVVLFVKKNGHGISFSHPPFPFTCDGLNLRKKMPFGFLSWGALCKDFPTLQDRRVMVRFG